MRETKAFLKAYRAWLKTYMGRRCEAKCNNCLSCTVWALYDLTEIILP